jgi:hypothetical protein
MKKASNGREHMGVFVVREIRDGVSVSAKSSVKAIRKLRLETRVRLRESEVEGEGKC